jgi:hypothetical protein
MPGSPLCWAQRGRPMLYLGGNPPARQVRNHAHPMPPRLRASPPRTPPGRQDPPLAAARSGLPAAPPDALPGGNPRSRQVRQYAHPMRQVRQSARPMRQVRNHARPMRQVRNHARPMGRRPRQFPPPDPPGPGTLGLPRPAPDALPGGDCLGPPPSPAPPPDPPGPGTLGRRRSLGLPGPALWARGLFFPKQKKGSRKARFLPIVFLVTRWHGRHLAHQGGCHGRRVHS